MNVMTYAGLIIAILLIAVLAVMTGMKKSTGKKEGISAGVAAGLIMGTLVGGSSTVGTAQLAYNYGMSAWWFTLGGGIACLVLALVYVRPLRAHGSATLVGMIDEEYGPKAGKAASVLNSIGTLINIFSQLLSASAVILVVWPNMGTAWTILITAFVMVLYVVFGGAKGAGIVGVLKMGLLYAAMIICGLLALNYVGGAGALASAVSSFGSETGRNFASLFCRGAGTDLGACVSLILGVLTTQTYAQAVLTAKSERTARGGALISAFLIPPIGIFGIIVGLYMRTVTDPAVFTAKTALTSFILNYSGLPNVVGGFILGTLFIASVGTGAGLALGIATVFNRELIQKAKRKPSMNPETINKILIVAVLAVAAAICCAPIGETILNFAFLSMGLRGCTVFAPLCFVLWAKGKVDGKYALASILAGSLTALVLGVLDLFEIIVLPCDSVFPGVLVGLLIMFVGYFATNRKIRTEGASIEK